MPFFVCFFVQEATNDGELSRFSLVQSRRLKIPRPAIAHFTLFLPTRLMNRIISIFLQGFDPSTGNERLIQYEVATAER